MDVQRDGRDGNMEKKWRKREENDHITCQVWTSGGWLLSRHNPNTLNQQLCDRCSQIKVI